MSILEVDLDKKIEIKIDNKAPVGLEDLTVSLLSFSHQFHRFVEAETNNDNPIGSQLYVKEVRKGSIIIELVAQAAPVIPLLWEGGTLAQWSSVVQQTCQWLLGKTSQPPREFSKQDLKQWKSFVEPVAKDNAAQININCSEGGTVIQQTIINSNDANAMQNRIERLMDEMDEPDDNVHRSKVMYWYQAKFDSKSETGNQAIIESISKKSCKVIFENQAVKDHMFHAESELGKPWHELAYVVDVEVQTVRGSPRLYKVLKYYPEHTFDPDA